MNAQANSDEVYSMPPDAEAATPSRSDVLMSLPVSVSVSVGRAKATIEELLAITSGTILTLDARIDDPVELMVGDRIIGQGRLVELGDGDGFGVEILTLAANQDRA